MRVQVSQADALRGRTPAAAPFPAGRRARTLTTEEQSRASGVFGHDFHHDFGKVRVYDDAELADAGAATIGSSVYLTSGVPEPQRRSLLGHELAHVVQQSPQRAPRELSDEAALESEAERAGEAFAAGRPAAVERRARAAAPQFARVTVGTRVFEVGDITVNTAASTDIRTHGNLLPGADQAHLIVHGNQLGYEVSYTTPEDPFRWNQFKSMVDNDHVDILGVSLTTTIPTNIITPNNPPTPNPVSLASFMAGGFTLLTLSRQQAVSPGRPVYVASPDPARDKIYYDTGAGGRGSLGTNSLAHELFGHFGLARAGAPSGHGATVPASAGVTDPFGQRYAGSVNDYISNFAGASGGIVESPTRFVSAAFLQAALNTLRTSGASGLVGTQAANTWRATSDFDLNWIKLSLNYRVLTGARLPPPPPATTAPAGTPSATPSGSAQPAPSGTAAPTSAPSAAAPTTTAATIPTTAQIETTVVTWYNGLTTDQKWVFRQYINSITSAFTSSRPAELARAVEPRL